MADLPRQYGPTLQMCEQVLAALGVLLQFRKASAAFRDIAGFLRDARLCEYQLSLLGGFRPSSSCSDTADSEVTAVCRRLSPKLVLSERRPG